MRVLVTGASGFLGIPIVDALVRAGAKITGLSRSAQLRKDWSKVDWINADISKPSTFGKAVEAFAPETVIHLAWSDLPDYSFDTLQYSVSGGAELMTRPSTFARVNTISFGLKR